MSDERMLKRMRITAKDAESDPHHGCLVRWIEEREKRELAERTTVKNAETYQRIMEARDLEIERVRAHFQGACLVAAVLLLAFFVLLAVRR